MLVKGEGRTGAGPGWAVSAKGPQGGAPQAGAEGGQVKKKGCGRDSVSCWGLLLFAPFQVGEGHERGLSVAL